MEGAGGQFLIQCRGCTAEQPEKLARFTARAHLNEEWSQWWLERFYGAEFKEIGGIHNVMVPMRYGRREFWHARRVDKVPSNLIYVALPSHFLEDMAAVSLHEHACGDWSMVACSEHFAMRMTSSSSTRALLRECCHSC